MGKRYKLEFFFQKPNFKLGKQKITPIKPVCDTPDAASGKVSVATPGPMELCLSSRNGGLEKWTAVRSWRERPRGHYRASTSWGLREGE